MGREVLLPKVALNVLDLLKNSSNTSIHKNAG